MATIKKAQTGKNVPKGKVESEMFPGTYIDSSAVRHGSYITTDKKKPAPKKPVPTPTKKAKAGGSFPDLNKDGKITKADILKGRGVIAKKGAMVKAKAKMGCKACWGTKMKKK